MARPTAAQLMRRLPFPLSPPTVPGGVEPPKTESKVGANYDTEWARSYPAGMARVATGRRRRAPGTRQRSRHPKVHGLDRLDGVEGSVVFAANHHSHFDTPLLLSLIPEPWRHHIVIGAAADYFFGNRVTSTLSALVIGAIPIERPR